jgi:hypothetical protein
MADGQCLNRTIAQGIFYNTIWLERKRELKEPAAGAGQQQGQRQDLRPADLAVLVRVARHDDK